MKNDNYHAFKYDMFKIKSPIPHHNQGTMIYVQEVLGNVNIVSAFLENFNTENIRGLVDLRHWPLWHVAVILNMYFPNTSILP